MRFFNQTVEFPNLFNDALNYMDDVSLVKLIESNLLRILKRLRFPPAQDLSTYAMPSSPDYIFTSLQDSVQKVIFDWHKKNNTAINSQPRIYVSGDIIPALLGRLYAELLAKVTNKNHGEGDLKNQLISLSQDENDIVMLTQLIVAGDIDVYLQLDTDNEELNKLLVDAVNKLKLPDCNIKCTITNNLESLKQSVAHGKTTLNLLYLELTDADYNRLTQHKNIPSEINILKDFFQGNYRFITDIKSSITPQHLIKALQIPFLNLSDSHL